LILKNFSNEWGPKPFRFNNHWLENKNFKKVVEASWRGFEVSGFMGFVLKEKLRGLKFKLKDWSKLEFGNIEEKVKTIIGDIHNLDVKGEISGLNSIEVSTRKDMFGEFWNLQKIMDANIFQRSRSKWLSQGDAYSKFFHRSIVARLKRNSIVALKVDEVWLESPAQIREAVTNFFANHFKSRCSIRPNLDGVVFPSLSPDDNRVLTATFSLDKIHAVIRESDGNKCPGPDGFNFAFLKNCWELLKGEIIILFDQFHGKGSLPKSLLSYFVTLIPKVSLPFQLGDYRPISLLGCLYKIIAKVLTNRLAKVMNSLIEC
jgi:hypothetical protein